MPGHFTLGKNERLKSRKQIDKLFAEGKSFVTTPFKIYFLMSDEPGKSGLQFGVGVSSRNFKRSVDRNRIKRLTREAWRLQKNELKDNVRTAAKLLNVFFIYTGKELPDFKTIKDKVGVALKKLWKSTNENSSANT